MSPLQATVQPPSPPTILSRLRLETRGEHEAVERVLDLMSTSLTRQGYRERLEQFHGFYAPLEIALRDRLDEKGGPSGELFFSPATRSALVERFNKTAHLRQDLHYLGVMEETLPHCRDLPPLRTEADVLGCVYVMEGATLGGRMITQHVQATLGITPTTGGSFFEGYGDDTGRKWQAMRQMLVNGSPDIDTENDIVTNAITTFACLRSWCESLQNQTETETLRNE